MGGSIQRTRPMIRSVRYRDDRWGGRQWTKPRLREGDGAYVHVDRISPPWKTASRFSAVRARSTQLRARQLSSKRDVDGAAREIARGEPPVPVPRKSAKNRSKGPPSPPPFLPPSRFIIVRYHGIGRWLENAGSSPPSSHRCRRTLPLEKLAASLPDRSSHPLNRRPPSLTYVKAKLIRSGSTRRCEKLVTHSARHPDYHIPRIPLTRTLDPRRDKRGRLEKYKT